MCGRYRLTKRRILEIEQYYGIDDMEDLDIWKREYNIPPREMAPIIYARENRLRLTPGLWGLMPDWADKLEQANKISTFNARAESVGMKPAFSGAFFKHRCIVPAEAFYEWVGPKSRRQPLYVSRRDGGFLSMAGLYNLWKPQGSAGRPLPTFTILTTKSNGWMDRIHDRMPLILPDGALATWLQSSDLTAVRALLHAPPDDLLQCHPVDRIVNSVRVDAPECSEPIVMDYEGLLKQPSVDDSRL